MTETYKVEKFIPEVNQIERGQNVDVFLIVDSDVGEVIASSNSMIYAEMIAVAMNKVYEKDGE